MGLIENLKNRFLPKQEKDLKPEGTYDLISMRTGYFSYKGKLLDSDIVRSAIRPKARAISKARPKHIKNNYSDENTSYQVDASPHIKFLLVEPNAYMTGQNLQEKLIWQLELNGNAFAFIDRDEFGNPIAIYPINASSVEVLKDKYGEIYLSFRMFDGKSWVARYRNIIHLRKDFSEDEFMGSSPAESLTQLMKVIDTTDQTMINAMKNSTVIRWLLKYQQNLKRSDLERNAKEFAETYTATSSKTGGIAAVGGGADIEQVKMEDAYLPGSGQNEVMVKRVYSFFNTNADIVNSSYTEDEWISYYESAVEPDLLQLANELTRKLFTRNQRAYGNEIIFTSSNLTFASMQTKLKLSNFVDRGIMTPNEVRAVLGLEPAKGGDRMIRRLDTAPTDEDEDEGDNNEDN